MFISGSTFPLLFKNLSEKVGTGRNPQGKGNDGGGLHDFRREFCAGQGKSRVVSTMVGASGREVQWVFRHGQGKKQATQDT